MKKLIAFLVLALFLILPGTVLNQTTTPATEVFMYATKRIELHLFGGRDSVKINKPLDGRIVQLKVDPTWASRSLGYHFDLYAFDDFGADQLLGHGVDLDTTAVTIFGDSLGYVAGPLAFVLVNSGVGSARTDSLKVLLWVK